MPVYTSDALILRTYKLAEADRIVVFLTRDRGKKRGVAKGARRARSRFTGTLEALTRASVAYYERELRDLVRINYVEPQQSALAAVARGTNDASALGEVLRVAERRRVVRTARHGRERALLRLDIIDPHEVPQLPLVVRDAGARQCLERTREPRAGAAGTFCDAALLASITRQKDDDAIGFRELVGAENQCVGCIDRHGTILRWQC